MDANAIDIDDIEEKLPPSPISENRVYIIFFNLSGRCVYVTWSNFKGDRVIYTRLHPRHVLPMYTYERHPWVFEDMTNGERMLANGENVYSPVKAEGNRATEVHITRPFYSLRQIVINVIRDNIEEIGDIDSLQIPSTLYKDIKEAVKLKERKLLMYTRCKHLD